LEPYLPRYHRSVDLLFYLGHNSFSWVKIRLYIENQLPRSSGSALKVCVVGGGWMGGGGVESDFTPPKNSQLVLKSVHFT
jgi:hypothetical protein